MINEKAKKIIDMINYQDGSVVSRTLIDRPTGTVTLFAFDKDQGLSEHTAPFDALLNVIDGEAEIRIDTDKYNLSVGEMIILPANHTHSVLAISKFKMVLTMIKEQND